MSATGRGAERRAYDDYQTPEWVIDQALARIPLPATGWVLEPCAGEGRIIRALDRRQTYTNVMGIDINPKYSGVLTRDFLVWAYFDYPRQINELGWPSLIISNPPYRIAQSVVEAALQVGGPNTMVMMLLRLGFLESKKRRDWWQEHPIDALYVLSKRPKFTGKGTDATAYGWFVWDGLEKGVFVL